MTGLQELYDHKIIYGPHGLTKAPLLRKITSPLRMRPSLFIVGAQKAGTTSLAAYLSRQPGVIPPWEKEISYFNNEHRFRLGDSWYRSFFPTLFTKWSRDQQHAKAHFTFDASANYFEETRAAERISTAFPDARIIILLRDPVQRAWSHYKMALRYGFETRTFREALALEEQRIAAGKGLHNFAFQRLGYRSKGIYMNFLPAWKELFGERLHLLFFEELFSNDPSPLEALHRFLDLDAADPSLLAHLNKGSEEQMNDQDLQDLRDFYAPYDRQLQSYLNRKLPW